MANMNNMTKITMIAETNLFSLDIEKCEEREENDDDDDHNNDHSLRVGRGGVHLELLFADLNQKFNQ